MKEDAQTLQYDYMPEFQYKSQPFQQKAVASIIDMFRGIDFGLLQRNQTATSLSFVGADKPDQDVLLTTSRDFMQAHYEMLDKNLSDVQNKNGIKCKRLRSNKYSNNKLSVTDDIGEYLVLDTQMETGTGKTFTLINTILELNQQYNLKHFIIIVPSIAIKEGIKKSFDTTMPYFLKNYGARMRGTGGVSEIKVLEIGKSVSKKGRNYLPSGISDFIKRESLTVLIMIKDSFNSDKNLINREIEGAYTDNERTAMDAIAKKSPVLIIDEPQRVEGEATAKRIKRFNPLFVLRYSATYKENQARNLVYILDSYDAFNMNLVKHISVTDYKVGKTDSAMLGVSSISNGMATIEATSSNGKILRVTTGIEPGKGNGKIFKSTGNRAYRNLRVTRIDSANGEVGFSDGRSIELGGYGLPESANERSIAEVMLRDTIETHLQKERFLFHKNIKCLSLIFIDRVKHYRGDKADGSKGYLEEIFESCYEQCKKDFIKSLGANDPYRKYLDKWDVSDIHGGYFSDDGKSIDNAIDYADRNNEKAKIIQQKITELILRDKENLLSMQNHLRFIFAHSTIREGWDNPNVFQICKLRTGFSTINIVQEVGRGLRICVNGDLCRQDIETVGDEFYDLNRLDVFTLGNGEFIKHLQREVDDRRSSDKVCVSNIQVEDLQKIYNLTRSKSLELTASLINKGCINDDGKILSPELTHDVLISHGLDPDKIFGGMFAVLDRSRSIVDNRKTQIKERKYRSDVSHSHYAQFKRIWDLLHQNVIYEVKYSDDFENKVVERINDDKATYIPPLKIERVTADLVLDDESPMSIAMQASMRYDTGEIKSNMSVQEFVYQLSSGTNLPRNTIIDIISKVCAKQYKAMQNNPSEAIVVLSKTIMNVVYENVIERIRYRKVSDFKSAETKVTLTDGTFRASRWLSKKDVTIYANNSVWVSNDENGKNEWIAPFDSIVPEKNINDGALAERKIVIFGKLPRGINIPTPINKKGVNPDFAFVIDYGDGKRQFYFIAESKPTLDTHELRFDEQRKIALMERYFEDMDMQNVHFRVVKNYQSLLDWFKDTQPKENVK